MTTRTALIFVLILIQCTSIINGDTDEIEVCTEEFEEVANALNFNKKVVLISGSSSGIGATTARLYAKLGAQVVVTGRNQSRIDQVIDDCRQLSPNRLKPLGITLDLTIPGNAAKLVNATIAAYKKVDVLVNAAGIGLFVSIEDPKFNQVYKDVKAINEEANVELTRLCVPYIKSTNGAIIFISSILGSSAVATTGGYSMSKAAIISFAQSVALDVGTTVRVNVISPGIVDGTRIFRLVDPCIQPNLIRNSIAASSNRRPGVPLDIAKLIVFSSTILSTSINGQNLHADQGLYIPLL